MFLAVPVEAGRHVVRLEYRPREWVLGGWLAALGSILLLGLIVTPRRLAAAPADLPRSI
jgi:hypothetical protein